MIKFIQKHQRVVIGIVLWMGIFGLYGSSAARTMTGFGDSDELIAAGYTLSVAHPPGYPLLTYLLYLVTHVPFLSPGVAAHLLAAFIMSLTMMLLFLCVIKIGFKRLTTIQFLVSTAIVLLVASSGLLWEHGNVIEVFGLNALFSIGLFWLTARFVETKKIVYLYYWALLTGVGFSHQQTFILTFIPLFGWLVTSLWRQNRKYVYLGRMAGIGIVTFLLCYGSLLWLNSESPYSWKFSPTISGLIDFYLRKDYSGYSTQTGKLTAWLSGFSLPEMVNVVKFYFFELWRHWGVIMVFGLIGLGAGCKRPSHQRIVIILFLLSGPIFSMTMALPQGATKSVYDETNKAIMERMFVLSELWWGMLTAIGVKGLMSMLSKQRQWLFVGGVGLLALLNIGLVYPERTLSSYSLAELYHREMLSPMPEGSKLVCLSDISCFGMNYIQSVLGYRRDIVVISSAPQYRAKTFENTPGLALFNYPDNPYRIGETIGYSTSKQQPVFISQLDAYWNQTLGLNGEAFWLLPATHSLEIRRDPTIDLSYYQPTYQVSLTLVDKQLWLSHRFVRVMQSIVTEEHAITATLMARMQKYMEVAREVQAGLAIEPDNPSLVSIKNTVGSYPGDPRYHQSPTEMSYVDRFTTCKQAQDLNCMVEGAQQLTWRNPTNANARLTLANLYEQVHVEPLAKREYQHVLMIDPTNSTASAALNRLIRIPDLGEELE